MVETDTTNTTCKVFVVQWSHDAVFKILGLY